MMMMMDVQEPWLQPRRDRVPAGNEPGGCGPPQPEAGQSSLRRLGGGENLHLLFCKGPNLRAFCWIRDLRPPGILDFDPLDIIIKTKALNCGKKDAK